MIKSVLLIILLEEIFHFVKNKVTKFKGDEMSLNGTNMILEGEPINVQYVLSVDRIIQTEEDMA